jgi:hypothetical protein
MCFRVFKKFPKVVGSWSMFEFVVLILAKAISSYECKKAQFL